MRKPRSRAYNRDVSMRKALRKKRITEEVFHPLCNPYYPALGYFNKAKIHCSCGLCSSKTRNKGRRRRTHANYQPSIDYKHSEKKRQVAMDFDELEYFSS